MSAVWNERVVYLKSLSEICILDFTNQPAEMKSIIISSEPTSLSIGPTFAAVVQSAVVTFFELTPSPEIKADLLQYHYTKVVLEQPSLDHTGKQIEKTYPAKVLKLETNFGFAMVKCKDGKVILHPLSDSYLKNDAAHMVFPPPPSAVKICAAALTFGFLLYATTEGILYHFSLHDLIQVQQFNAGRTIKDIIPQPGIGTKMILIDEKDNAVVYNPITDSAVSISGWNNTFIGALWETDAKAGRCMFVAWTESIVSTYSYHQYTAKGAQCISLHVNTKLPYGFKPILFKDSAIVCQSLGGSLEKVPLYSHREYTAVDFLEAYPVEVDQARMLRVLYLIGQEKFIWSLCPAISSKKAWVLLAEALLQLLDLRAAKKIFRIIGDVGMVMNLERIEQREERNEQIGHICVLFGDFNLAQQFFIKSANPKEALFLRKDLLEWEQALVLAKKIAPEEISAISLEYGNQLEMDGFCYTYAR